MTNEQELLKQIESFSFSDFFNMYPEECRSEVIKRTLDIIQTNLQLRNPSHRKRKVSFKCILFEIIVRGLIEKDIENQKIEAAIKFAKGEIDEEEFEKIINK